MAEQILAEPGWYALAATLADAEAAGHDRAALLTEAVGQRELNTAASISDVLVWRLRRAADLPADSTSMPHDGDPTEHFMRRPRQRGSHPAAWSHSVISPARDRR
ncbi:hypothetical protein GCM10010365_21010 [Streptomyces poonensis]|uniref:Uncharacterized protein n=1 Tax=Streptomyces poonensis TaxID=68255 RepID=A0A918PF56_9ACTN|nr:hypothetical protein GCM10010365_21010 [Streptomyces poonensis]GLJ93508.1 hypothetical protein GCM10017589_61220 [Streptomyces poonensis]